MTPPAKLLADAVEQITRAVNALEDAASGLLITTPATSAAYQEAVRSVGELSAQAEQALFDLESTR